MLKNKEYIKQSLIRCIFIIHLISISLIAKSQEEFISAPNSNDEELVVGLDDSQPINNALYSIPTTRYPDPDKIDGFRADSRFEYVKPEAEKADPTWLDDFLLKFFGAIGKFFEWLFGSEVLTFIVIVLFVFAILVIVMRIAKIDLKQVFAKKWKEELSETDILTGNDENIGFNKLIQDALSVGDYRLAIRYMYLRNLKSLSDRNYIAWAENKTNYSYQSEIQDKDIRDRFLATTILFDYVWYGEFPIQEAEFAIAEKKMNAFNKMITDER